MRSAAAGIAANGVKEWKWPRETSFNESYMRKSLYYQTDDQPVNFVPCPRPFECFAARSYLWPGGAGGDDAFAALGQRICGALLDQLVLCWRR